MTFFFFFLKLKSSTAVCRSKEELEAAFPEYVVYLDCSYECWVGGKKHMEKTSPAPGLLSVTFVF